MSAISILLDIDSGVKTLFDYASDLTKQLLTLSVAIITLSAAFVKDIAKTNSRKIKRTISLCWIFNFLSISFGILVLMALTGAIDDAMSPGAKVSLPPNARFYVGLQIITFLSGIVTIIIYGNMGFMNNQTDKSHTK